MTAKQPLYPGRGEAGRGSSAMFLDCEEGKLKEKDLDHTKIAPSGG